jgi:hypothetical protein
MGKRVLLPLVSLYLTTTGWRTGWKHEIEIWFVQHNGKYYLISEDGYYSHWVQNIEHDPTLSSASVRKSCSSWLESIMSEPNIPE